MTIPASLPLASRRTGALKGVVRVPGDKSISHRALILGLLAAGETTIEGLLEADDVKRTAAAVEAFGGEVNRDGPGRWRVWGVGVGGLMEPRSVLDLGNSGTGTRLLMGAAATTPIVATFTGDASLSRRPMDRVVTPLEQMGASFRGRGGSRLPMTMTGARDPMPIAYRLPVASAQVKSAVLLAGLNTPGTTMVIEPTPTRDHTERMLRNLGAEVEIRESDGEGRIVTLAGEAELAPGIFEVPADPSSAAFPLVAALLVEGSAVTVQGVSVNPLRTGLYETLQEMGAVLEFADCRELGGEPVADITARASRLSGVTVPAQRAPSMIDEYPVLAIAAAFAEGTTVLEGLAELRVKESDRLAAVAAGLREIGVDAAEHDDGLTIEGCAGPAPGGGWVTTELDHRIAMAFLTAGLASEKPVAIDDGSMIETSFPDFVGLMTGLGASIDRKNR